MSEYVSGIGPYIEKLFDYRRSLGYSGASHHTILKHLDRFCAAYFPEEQNLTEELVLAWIGADSGIVYEKSVAARLLGKYMCAIGKEAYILPEKYVTAKHDFVPHIFTDDELNIINHKNINGSVFITEFLVSVISNSINHVICELFT